jgi:hypothetical protein
MNLGRNRPKCSPNHIFVKINTQIFTVEIVAQKIRASSVIKNAQVVNRPSGKKSPKLVTLFRAASLKGVK